MSVVGKNVAHDSAAAYVTGEAQFIDDVPPALGEVIVDFVGSPVASGRIRRIELEAARRLPGIVGVFTHRDVPGHNEYGPMVRDDRVLAENSVRYMGEPVVLLVGESREALKAAKRLIEVDVEPEKPILSIDEAKAAGSFLGPERTIFCGDA